MAPFIWTGLQYVVGIARMDKERPDTPERTLRRVNIRWPETKELFDRK